VPLPRLGLRLGLPGADLLQALQQLVLGVAQMRVQKLLEQALFSQVMMVIFEVIKDSEVI
jgi:uncharacterized membrane protein (DUF2068 family)